MRHFESLESLKGVRVPVSPGLFVRSRNSLSCCPNFLCGSDVAKRTLAFQQLACQYMSEMMSYVTIADI